MTLGKSREPPRLGFRVAEAVSFRDVLRYSALRGNRSPFDEHLEFMHDKFWASQVLGQGFKISRSAAIYLHVRPREIPENWRRENRAYRDLYRARRYRPLSGAQRLSA